MDFACNCVISCFLPLWPYNIGRRFYWWITFDQTSQYAPSLYFARLSWHPKPIGSPSFAKTWQWLCGSFYCLRQTSMRSVGVLQPGFSKMATTFSSEASSSTSLGRPTMSSHSRLEYCAFNQHWTSIVTSLLDRRILTCFVTGASACNLEKNLIQLTHLYQRNLIYLLKKRRYIGIRSFFFIFCNDLFV